jgi:hypothetical protein
MEPPGDTPKAGKMTFSSSDPSSGSPSGSHALLKEHVKSVIMKLQSPLKLHPQDFCLVSGAPRSGTSVLGDWLGHQPGVAAFLESRILVGIHRFMEDVERFQNLDRNRVTILKLARRLVLDYYSSSRILVGERLLIDKEPLEPIAFPLKDYGRFLVNMRKLFPESKLLLALRDPVATVWSMTRRTWGESLTAAEAKRFPIEEYQENWASCADLVLEHCSDPNTYIVQFGRLVHDPIHESRRILEFLEIRKGRPFEPGKTKEIGFNSEEKEKILGAVRPQLERLKARGISELQ